MKDLPKGGLIGRAYRLVRYVTRMRIPVYASNAGFFIVLSIFPMLLLFVDVLTGFKFIGEKIKDFEENGYYKEYLFGFEESYGYLAGTHARDKDAVVAAMLIAEMAADYKEQGLTLYEGLVSLYEKYGYFMEATKSVVLSGIDGSAKIDEIMTKFRSNPLTAIAGTKVENVWDVKASTVTDVVTGAVTPLDLPKSNVIRYNLEGNAWMAIRPSGTEPKIKFYYGVCEKSEAAAYAKIDAMVAEIADVIG